MHNGQAASSQWLNIKLKSIFTHLIFKVRKMKFGIYTEPVLSASDITTIQQGKMSNVYMQLGTWAEGNAITINPQDAQINAYVSACHAAGLKAYAWIGVPAGANVLDLTTATNQTTAITNMITVCNQYNFDGIADDPEQIIFNVYSDLIAYFNQAAATLHLSNKEYYCAMLPYWSTAYGSTLLSTLKIDGVLALMYGFPNDASLQSNFDTFLTFFLQNITASPLHIVIHSDSNGLYPNLSATIQWIIQLLDSGISTANLGGVDIFWYTTMDDGQWGTWLTWTLVSGSTTTPPTTPPTTSTGCFIATVAGMTPDELTQLRAVRDFVKNLPSGAALVDFYYANAPKYVALVNANPQLKKDIHDAIELILAVVKALP